MELDAERRKIVLSGFIWRPGNDLPRPTTEDRSRLSESLSREARDLLTKASDDEERDRILDSWIRAATFSRMWRQPSSEELEKFAKKLTPEQREHLESLPRERMFEELRKMYYRDRFPDRGRGSGFRRPGRGPGGGPPGGPGQPGGSGGPGGDHRRRGGKFPD